VVKGFGFPPLPQFLRVSKVFGLSASISLISVERVSKIGVSSQGLKALVVLGPVTQA
jgi:hypothetical protein